MKKSLKKYLMLALVIVAMITVTVSVAYAATVTVPATINCGNCGIQKAALGNIYEATCDTDGYTEIICANCGRLHSTDGVVEKLGHDLKGGAYLPVKSGDTVEYYKQVLTCQRQGCVYSEDESRIITNDQGEPEAVVVEYCKVNFINDFLAVKFESEVFCPYAKLAAADAENAYIAETETIYVEYPADNGKTPVSATGKPYRMADKYFGKYEFSGWLSAEEIASTYNASGLAKTFSMLHDTNEVLTANRFYDDVLGTYVTPAANKQYHDALVDRANLARPSVTAETPAEYNLHAIFKANTNVRHTVKFYNFDGTLLYDVEVSHATQAAEYEAQYPERADNLEYTYDFLYWELEGTTTRLSSDLDIDVVYADINAIAYYKPTLREYNFKYFMGDGVTPVLDTIDTVTLAGFEGEKKLPEVGFSIANQKLVKAYSDEAYVYEPTGRWLIPSRNDYIVDLNHVTLPAGTLDNTEIDYITLVPEYQKYLRMYELPVSIIYDNDGNYHPKELSIQVTSAEGKVIGFATINQSSEYYKDGTYKIVFDVSYSKSYTIAVTSTGYTGKTTTNFHIMNPDTPDDDTPGNAIVTMKKLEADPCGCICHTVFKPVWVGVLKLLHSIFKIEYVCCDDMYANIGSELNYGPAVNNK